MTANLNDIENGINALCGLVSDQNDVLAVIVDELRSLNQILHTQLIIEHNRDTSSSPYIQQLVGRLGDPTS